MYGKFPEFFRKNSVKFPTFYFSGKLTTLVQYTAATREYSSPKITRVDFYYSSIRQFLLPDNKNAYVFLPNTPPIIN